MNNVHGSGIGLHRTCRFLGDLAAVIAACHIEQPVLVGDSIGARAGWDRPAAASDAISRVRIVLRNEAMASFGSWMTRLS